MTYRLGLEVGASATSWAVVPHPAPPGSTAIGGTVASVVAVSTDGRLLAGAEVVPATAMRAMTSEFVDSLGAVEPVMLAGTPYGIEALIGHLLASILRTVHRQQGEWPQLLALAHTDSLDEYRRGLLAEAARSAGVPLSSVVLVATSRAIAAFDRSGVAAPAVLGVAVGSTLADRDMTTPPAVGRSIGGPVAGAVGGAVGGVAAAAIGAGAAGEAAALAPAAYGGTPLITGSAYGGTPLATAGTGYTGTPLATGGTGYAGTPLASPGSAYGGTPLASPGPGSAGSPLPAPDAAGAGGTGAPDATGGASGGGAPGQAKRLRGLKRLGPRRGPLVAGASAAAAAIAIAAGAFAMNDDTPLTARADVDPPVPTIVIPTPTPPPPAPPAPTDAPTPEPTTAPSTAPPTTVLTPSQCVLGAWEVRPDTFLAGTATQVAAAGLTVDAVSGGAGALATADGHFVLTYRQLTVTATAPEGNIVVSVTFDGTIDSLATFGDDGTMSLTSNVLDGTITTTVIVDGAAQQPTTTPLDDEFAGTSAYTCDANVLQVEAPGRGAPVIMDRSVTP